MAEQSKNLSATNLAEDILNQCDFGEGVGLDIPCNVCKKVEEPLQKEEVLGESHPELTKDERIQEIKEHLQQSFNLIAELPQSDALALLEEFRFVAEQTLQSLKINLAPLPDPDDTGKSYPLYPPKSGVDPIEHLEKHWGTWLKRFNPKLGRDYLFQDQLRQRDPSLVNAVKGKLDRRVQKGEATERLKDYISANTVRKQSEINELPDYYRENAARFSSLINRLQSS